MPITPEQKQKFLTSKGYDPSQWDLQESQDGSSVQAVPKSITPQPSASPDGMAGMLSNSIARTQQETTASDAALHHVATSAIPSAVGIGTGALIGSFFGPGLGTAIGAGIGGAVTSYGASKLQEKLLTEKFKQQLALEEQQHKWASLAGDFAPSLGVFKSGNLGTLMGGVKNLPQALANTKTLSTAERAILGNAAVNMGVGGGIDLAQQLSSDQPMDYGKLGMTLATGALLNEPTKLGKLMGFHGTPTEVRPVIPRAVEPIVPMATVAPESPVDLMQRQADAFRKATSGKSGKTYPQRTDKMSEYARTVTPDPAELANMEAEGGIVAPVQYENKRVEEYNKALAEKQLQDLQEQRAVKSELDRQEAAQLASQNAERALALKNQLEANRLSAQEQRPAPLAVTELGKEIPKDYTGNIEHDRIQNAKPLTEAERIQAEYDKQYAAKSHVTEEELNSLEAGKIPITLDRLSPDFRTKLVNLYAERAKLRGQTPNQFQPEVVTPEGNQVAGYHEERSNVYSESKAGPDTLPHEQAGHGMINDLANSSDPADVKLAQRGKDIFKSHADPSEALAIEMGKKMVGRDVTTLYGTKGEKFKNYWKDVMAQLKVKTGLENDADVIRHLNRRFETDAPYGKNTELLTAKNMAGSPKQTSTVETPKEAPATYLGYQEGFGKVPGSHLYNLNEDLNPKMVKGSTVSRSEIEKAGYKIPASEAAKEAIPAAKQYADKSHTTPDDIKLGHLTPELKDLSHESEPLPYKTFAPTRSVNDTIRKKGGIAGNLIADAVEKYHPAVREVAAQYRNPIRDSLSKLSPDESARLEQILHAEDKSSKAYPEYANTERMKESYKTIRDTLTKMQQDQIDAKQPVKDWKGNGAPYMREAKINTTYFPNKMSPLVMRTLAEHPETHPSVVKLKADYMDLQKQSGISDATAKAKWESLVTGIDKSQPDMTRFNAVRKAEGTGLPDSFQKSGLLFNLEAYIHRTALDRAHYEHFEKNPEVASAMGYKTDPWGKPWDGGTVEPSKLEEVRGLKEKLEGSGFDKTERGVKAWSRLATSAMLGPLTNIHIAFSSLANALSNHAPGDIVKGVTHMLTNWHESNQHAIENGYIKKDTRHLSDLVDAHADTSDKLGTAAAFIGKINGRELTDNVTKTLLQGAGEFLTKSNMAKAALGDKQALRFMKQVDNTYVPGKTYTDAEVSKLGSNFGELLHGAHDERTLPSWMLKETAIQPFLSLMSWNVAQTNHFMKHVWTPATEGNMKPLIMTTLGSMAGGYLIKEMREELSQRKAAFPNLQELAASDKGISGNIPLAAYNAMAMAQIAGFAGILSTAAKDVFDIAYKNIPQGASFPLDELLSNGAKTISQGLAAAINGDAPLTELAPRILKDVLQENVQLARLAITWGAKSGMLPQEALKQEITRGSKDVRNWQMAQGMPAEEQTSSENNPYLNLHRQEFKRTPDIGQAASLLPDLISRAFEKANGNPYVLQSQLRAIKQNDFPTMPSLEKAPMSFMSFLMYLEKTQGAEVAQERLHRYMEQNMINKAKSSMVPSF